MFLQKGERRDKTSSSIYRHAFAIVELIVALPVYATDTPVSGSLISSIDQGETVCSAFAKRKGPPLETEDGLANK